MIETKDVRGHVVMEGPEQAPLLVLNREGEGRVALLLSDQAWLWSRGFEGGGPYTYTDLLRRLAHWLMKEPDLEEDVLNAHARDDRLVVERHSMEGEIEPVELISPSGKKTKVSLEPSSPGIWRNSMAVGEHGVYRLKTGSLTAVAHVGKPNAREFSELAASDEYLKPILKATGGRSFWVASRSSGNSITLPRISLLRTGRVMHGSDWMGLKRQDAEVIHRIRLFPLLAGFAALVAMLGFITATWLREGG